MCAGRSSYLAFAYAASTTFFTLLMLLARKASVHLWVVWAALFSYQCVRLVQFSAKVLSDLQNDARLQEPNAAGTKALEGEKLQHQGGA